MCFLTAKNKVEIAIHVINLRFFEVNVSRELSYALSEFYFSRKRIMNSNADRQDHEF